MLTVLLLIWLVVLIRVVLESLVTGQKMLDRTRKRMGHGGEREVGGHEKGNTKR